MAVHPPSTTSPADGYAAITPSNSGELSHITRGVYVGTGGDVAAVRIDGTVVVFLGVPSGSLLPIRCMRVNATGTTASGLVALW